VEVLSVELAMLLVLGSLLLLVHADNAAIQMIIRMETIRAFIF
jgi:hypothetical protein